MNDYSAWNSWLKETSLVEDDLKKYISAYIHIGMDGVSLDGKFTPVQLREIADVVEDRINKIEEN